jgi:hypothetical protein
MPNGAALAALLVALSVTSLPGCGSRDAENSGAADAPPTASSTMPNETRKKVLLIGLDGIHVDILEQADTPNLNSLIAGGSFSADARTRPITVSGPGWSSMLTGVWMEKHGVESNDFTGSLCSASRLSDSDRAGTAGDQHICGGQLAGHGVNGQRRTDDQPHRRRAGQHRWRNDGL